jgi:hypothetical protein
LCDAFPGVQVVLSCCFGADCTGFVFGAIRVVVSGQVWFSVSDTPITERLFSRADAQGFSVQPGITLLNSCGGSKKGISESNIINIMQSTPRWYLSLRIMEIMCKFGYARVDAL